MRGKVTMPDGVVSTLGITPAHAGKSVELLDRTRPERDHPRTCGEKDIDMISAAA